MFCASPSNLFKSKSNKEKKKKNIKIKKKGRTENTIEKCKSSCRRRRRPFVFVVVCENRARVPLDVTRQPKCKDASTTDQKNQPI